jgi:hypothetical protein
MDYILNKEDYPGWRYYGKRYLRAEEFTKLCTAVGLYHSHESELEDYERARLLSPVARTVMPEEYAKAIWMHFQGGADRVEVDASYEPFHELDWALRYTGIKKVVSDNDLYHPIDLSWGKIDGLIDPSQQGFIPWNEYKVVFEHEGKERKQMTATHFYHHWQIYEFFLARVLTRGMYVAPAPVILDNLAKHIKGLISSFDATSYFQYLFRGKLTNLLEDKEPNEDNMWMLDESQQEELIRSTKDFAQETVKKYGFSEYDLHTGLKGLAKLHYDLSILERTRLADALKIDIWRLVELAHYAFGKRPEEIAHSVGGIAAIGGNYIELLFPDRRKRTKEQAVRIMNNLAEEHNGHAPNFAMTRDEIDRLFDYLDRTELVLLGYMLERCLEAHVAQHSWQVTEAFINLKSLASFPESMMKVVLLNSGDAVAINDFNSRNNRGMGTLNEIYFQNSMPNMWHQYQAAGHRSSNDAAQFTANLGHLIPLIVGAPDEDSYLGASLSLATCVRNFTSHLVLEDPALLQNQYVRCIRAITSSIFLIWHESRRRGWVN